MNLTNPRPKRAPLTPEDRAILGLDNPVVCLAKRRGVLQQRRDAELMLQLEAWRQAFDGPDAVNKLPMAIAELIAAGHLPSCYRT